ncbi:MAG: hypothetical protein CM15mP120_15600 [Pseudomonadota bacterium]|nr:MAG: hypothetical protein CM15mP120_15600 [Pseudomonadota bacterium]
MPPTLSKRTLPSILGERIRVASPLIIIEIKSWPLDCSRTPSASERSKLSSMFSWRCSWLFMMPSPGRAQTMSDLRASLLRSSKENQTVASICVLIQRTRDLPSQMSLPMISCRNLRPAACEWWLPALSGFGRHHLLYGCTLFVGHNVSGVH